MSEGLGGDGDAVISSSSTNVSVPSRAPTSAPMRSNLPTLLWSVMTASWGQPNSQQGAPWHGTAQDRKALISGCYKYPGLGTPVRDRRGRGRPLVPGLPGACQDR